MTFIALLIVDNLFLIHLSMSIKSSLNYNIDMKKEILKIILKVLIYALGLIGSAVGISALASCSSSRAVQVHGRGVVLIQDTTFIDHSSDYFRNYKSRY